MSEAEYEERASQLQRIMPRADATQLACALLSDVERRNGAQSELWADAQFLCAQVLVASGDIAAAIGALQGAASMQAHTPKQQQKKLTIEMNLGDLLRHAIRLDEAEDVLVRNLEQRRELYGVAHTGYAFGAEALAAVYLYQKRYVRAEARAREASGLFRGGDEERYRASMLVQLLAKKGRYPSDDVLSGLADAERSALLAHVPQAAKFPVPPCVPLLWEVWRCVAGDKTNPIERECLTALVKVSSAMGQLTDQIRALERLLVLPTARPEERATLLHQLAAACASAGHTERSTSAAQLEEELVRELGLSWRPDKGYSSRAPEQG
jgi:tetratricopeptide (TPR) repeat protein